LGGDDFIDFEKFDLGGQRGPRTHTPMGHRLPKKAVHSGTSKKIVVQLPAKSARLNHDDKRLSPGRTGGGAQWVHTP